MNPFTHPYFLALPGGPELLLILVLVVLFFGGRKIPDLMRGLGRGVKEFNDARGKNKNDKEVADNPKKEVLSDNTQNNS